MPKLEITFSKLENVSPVEFPFLPKYYFNSIPQNPKRFNIKLPNQ